MASPSTPGNGSACPINHARGHGTCHQPFQARNQRCVARRYLAGQVVVDGPTEAGNGDEHQAEGRLALRARSPDQQHASRDDGEHPKQDATIEILPEQKPGQQCRKHRFQIQQQRRGRRRACHQPIHERDRSRDAAKENGPRQPAPLAALREADRIPVGAPIPATGQDEDQAQTGTRVKQPRQYQRRNAANENLARGVLMPKSTADPSATITPLRTASPVSFRVARLPLSYRCVQEGKSKADQNAC